MMKVTKFRSKYKKLKKNKMFNKSKIMIQIIKK